MLRTIFQASQNYKPYPQFGTIRHYSNYGDNSYHGSHACAVRSDTRPGLVLNAFYTFSKTLNNGDDDGDVGGITFYNRALEKGRANYDIRHRFVSVMTYELPFGKGRKFMNQRRRDESACSAAGTSPTRRPSSRVRRLPSSFAGQPESISAGLVAAEPGRRRGSGDAELEHRREPLPDAGAGPVSERRGVRVSGRLHGRERWDAT